jgi:hypothetical protein
MELEKRTPHSRAVCVCPRDLLGCPARGALRSLGARTSVVVRLCFLGLCRRVGRARSRPGCPGSGALPLPPV